MDGWMDLYIIYICIIDDLTFSRTAKNSVLKTENLDERSLSTMRIYCNQAKI